MGPKDVPGWGWNPLDAPAREASFPPPVGVWAGPRNRGPPLHNTEVGFLSVLLLTIGRRNRATTAPPAPHRVSVVAQFLSKGPEGPRCVGQNGSGSPLSLAAAVVRLLVEARAEVDAPRKDGATGLMFAAEKNLPNCASLLLQVRPPLPTPRRPRPLRLPVTTEGPGMMVRAEAPAPCEGRGVSPTAEKDSGLGCRTPPRVGLFCRKKARVRGQVPSPCGAKLPGTPSPQEGLDPSTRPRVESPRRPIGSSLWFT